MMSTSSEKNTGTGFGIYELLQPPLRKIKIPFMEAYWDHREYFAVINSLLESMVKQDTVNELLEREVESKCRDLFNSKYVIVCDKGRSATLIGLMALGIKENDEVIMPSFFCRTLAQSVVQCGAKIVFADSNYDMNINIDSIKRCITKRTAAIIMPHMFGRICDVSAIKDIAKLNNLFLIDDAAVAAGGKLQDKFAGTFGDFGIVTFNIGKNMNATGGGVLLTDSEEIYEKVAKIRLGLPKQSFKEMKNKLLYTIRNFRHDKFKNIVSALRKLLTSAKINSGYSKALNIVDYYLDVDKIPVRYKMSGNIPSEYVEPCRSALFIQPKRINILESALARIQLDKLYEINYKSKLNTDCLNERLSNISEIVTPSGDSTCSYYQLFLKKGNRYELMKFLSERGIQSQWTFFPLHLQAKFSCFDADEMAITNQLWKKVISLPIQPSLNKEDIDYIGESIEDFYGY